MTFDTCHMLSLVYIACENVSLPIDARSDHHIEQLGRCLLDTSSLDDIRIGPFFVLYVYYNLKNLFVV